MTTDWPPVPILPNVDSVRRVRSGWKAAAVGFFLTVAFGLGWLVAPGPRASTADLFAVQETAAAVTTAPGAASVPFANPSDAAIAAALVQDPDLKDPRVTRIVGIYADDQVVDLRVQVQSGGFCHWYGVSGLVRDGILEWRGGPALACDG